MDQINTSPFLDANVLIEVIDHRKNLQLAVDTIAKSPNKPAISALTAHLVMYFGGKHAELDQLEGFLGDFTVLALESSDFEWAFRNIRGTDFEDALQIAVAVRNGYQQFVTFDAKLHKLYKTLPNIEIVLLTTLTTMQK